MIKKVFIMIMFILLMISLCACDKASEPSYEVFGKDVMEDIYFFSGNSINFSKEKYQNDSAQQSRNFKLNGKSFAVDYSYSTPWELVDFDVDVYKNDEDQLVMVKSGTDEIVRVSSNLDDFSISDKSEHEIREKAEKLLLDNFGVSVDGYEYSCSTYYQEELENAFEFHTENGFLISSDKLSVLTYRIHFTKKIAGYETLSHYSVHLSGEALNNRVMIECCSMDFSKEVVSYIKNINESNLKMSVLLYIQNNLKSEYTIENTEYGDITLFINDGQLYATLTCETILKDIPTKLTREYIVKIG